MCSSVWWGALLAAQGAALALAAAHLLRIEARVRALSSRPAPVFSALTLRLALVATMALVAVGVDPLAECGRLPPEAVQLLVGLAGCAVLGMAQAYLYALLEECHSLDLGCSVEQSRAAKRSRVRFARAMLAALGVFVALVAARSAATFASNEERWDAWMQLAAACVELGALFSALSHCSAAVTHLEQRFAGAASTKGESSAKLVSASGDHASRVRASLRFASALFTVAALVAAALQIARFAAHRCDTGPWRPRGLRAAEPWALALLSWAAVALAAKQTRSFAACEHARASVTLTRWAKVGSIDSWQLESVARKSRVAALNVKLQSERRIEEEEEEEEHDCAASATQRASEPDIADVAAAALEAQEAAIPEAKSVAAVVPV